MADAKTGRAVALIGELVERAHDALQPPLNKRALTGAIDEAFAFELWTRFIIRKHRRAFTIRQRVEMRRLLPGYMAGLYVRQFDRGMRKRPTVGRPHGVRKDVMVPTSYPGRNGRDLPVHWRVRIIRGRAQVIDVMVAGTSFIQLKREEFSAVIQRRGAEGLLDHLSEKGL
ncbi:MAG: ABC transporter substrate-binding protein [Pseudomonadota bacterium]